MSLLYLDPFIFFFVLLPISFVMFCLGILRHYATQLISSPSKPTLEMLKNMHLMKRATRLRTNAHVLTNEAWNARRSYLLKVLVKQDGKNNVENDPLAGLQQMKQQMLMIVPQMASMAWVSFFFSGFVLLKLPFGLTQRMKSMIQRGIVLKTLDASYVSSLSWYFLNMLGLSGIISLAIGAHESTEMKMFQAQMQMMSQPGVDPSQMFDSERNEVEMTYPVQGFISSSVERIIKN